ncbi:MAG: 50S ribosomal protein L23 [Candidatus Bathyarchaeia archaeon]
MDPVKVISYPLISEDSVKLIETENKITFIVDLKARKSQVKSAVEKLYEVEVESVNTCTTPTGLKKAYVRLKPEYKAADLAVKLGIL